MQSECASSDILSNGELDTFDITIDVLTPSNLIMSNKTF